MRLFLKKQSSEIHFPSFYTVHASALSSSSHSISHSPFEVHPARLSFVCWRAIPPVHIWALAATPDCMATISINSSILHTHVAILIYDHCPCAHSRGRERRAGQEKVKEGEEGKASETEDGTAYQIDKSTPKRKGKWRKLENKRESKGI